MRSQNFSRLYNGNEGEKAFVTCNRDEASLTKEAEWEAAVR
jgi:hypothetical protein